MCYFRFGIPSLDELINPNSCEYGYFNTGDEPGVFCILGPDGVGKSILALHAGSTYLADRYAPNAFPAVMYVSTDLKHSQAFRTFNAFGLSFPFARAAALRATVASSWAPEMYRHRLQLQWVAPKRPSEVDPVGLASGHEPDSLSKYMGQGPDGTFLWANRLIFLDLATSSSGDDWNTINRAMGYLTNFPLGDPHLMIIDAVEGLEAIVGEHDNFGEVRNRRSRIAQLVRLAKRARCHLLFVIEEMNSSDRLAEEFISDLVVRLRVVEELGYARRTIEIEKARGVAHIRGQHDLVTRMGTGSRTVDFENPDDPFVALSPDHLDSPVEVAVPAQTPHVRILQQIQLQATGMTSVDHSSNSLSNPAQPAPMCYLQVFQSLHAWERTRIQSARIDVGIANDQRGPHVFGDELSALNSLLQPRKGSPPAGVESGSTVVLIGDPGTYKSRLGRSFLSSAFRSDATATGAAVLISTYSIGRNSLATLLGTRNVSPVIDRIIVRHVTPHFLTSSGLFFLLAKTLERAYKVIGTWSENILERRAHAWRIRFVLDDWNVLLASHSNMARDPALLQTLLQFIQREGITALLIATQPGSPSASSQSVVSHDLRTLDTTHIYTWPVEFFGSRRTAITTFPSPSPLDPPLVYELRPSVDAGKSHFDHELLSVDRHFALYSALEEGHPQRTPLQVRLYSGYHTLPQATHDTPAYVSLVKGLFHDLYPTVIPGPEVVRFDHIEQYTDFAEFVQLLDRSRLDYTLVIQMDEFWKSDALADLSQYMATETAKVSISRSKRNSSDDRVTWKVLRNADEDPDEAFQPLPPATIDAQGQRSMVEPSIESRTRSSFFNREDYHSLTDNSQTCRRVPYSWDFGLILARRDLWWKARHNSVATATYATWHPESTRTSLRVGDVWNSLCVEGGQFRDVHGEQVHVSWPLFFEACRVVKGDLNVPTFDIDLRTSETLCSLVLEIWFSEVFYICQGQQSKAMFSLPDRPIWEDMCTQSPSLRWWSQQTAILMYCAIVELLEVTSHLSVDGSQPALRSGNPDSVATRHWYATASIASRKSSHLIPLRNPGKFSTRGDWFLSLAIGSRSQLLGERAIDKLTSRRMNILRLHDGLGLPARDVVERSQLDSLRSALEIHDADSNKKEQISYGRLKGLGASMSSGLKWLWRSGINDYDRHSFFFFRWLGRVLQNRDQILGKDQKARLTAFKTVFQVLYRQPGEESDGSGDLLANLSAGEAELIGQWDRYKQSSDELRDALRNTSLQISENDEVAIEPIWHKLSHPTESGILPDKGALLTECVKRIADVRKYSCLRSFRAFVDDRNVLTSVLREADAEYRM